MRHKIYHIIASVIVILLFSALTVPDEGMWMMNQLDKLPWEKMQKTGLQLTPEQIYNPSGTSLKDAIVLLGGGTSSFISAEGLLLTNHHVAYGAIQSVSSVEEDRLKDGFHAKTKEEEISIPSYSAQIVLSQKDVTSEVLSAVSDTMSDDSRSKAIQAKIREIEKSEKGESEYECRISDFYNGIKYFLFTFEVFRDVRLVYAPPTAIGNYGGEVDNWYWPRHTGDFSLMRVYVAPDGKHARYAKENVPYKPKVYLPISMQGYTEGSFAMIMGFPGRTYRYRTSPEVELARTETLPLTTELLKIRMDIMEEGWKNDRATEIAYAGRWRGMANGYKNFLGTLEGMRRADIMKVRNESDKLLSAFINTREDLRAKYGTVLTDIRSLYNEIKTYNRKQIVMGQLTGAGDMANLANRFRNYANSFAKDSTGEIRPPTSGRDNLRDAIPGGFKNINFNIDRKILVAMLLKAAELPPDQQIEAVQQLIGDRTGAKRDEYVKKYVDELYEDSKVTSTKGCEKLLDEDQEDILDDPFVQFVSELQKDNSIIATKVQAFNAKISRLRTLLLEAVMAWKGSDIYPDANRTLRFTFGEIKSYNPRDAVHYDYLTSLAGVIEKETGEDPFIVPPKLRQLWEQRDFGKYIDPKINDVPVAFLANLDITGGNSGSPVLNGKGEVIGLAFDGNWEAVVGDYLFQEPLNRSINVDSRYILFILDKFSNAKNILDELSIH